MGGAAATLDAVDRPRLETSRVTIADLIALVAGGAFALAMGPSVFLGVNQANPLASALAALKWCLILLWAVEGGVAAASLLRRARYGGRLGPGEFVTVVAALGLADTWVTRGPFSGGSGLQALLMGCLTVTFVVCVLATRGRSAPWVTGLWAAATWVCLDDALRGIVLFAGLGSVWDDSPFSLSVSLLTFISAVTWLVPIAAAARRRWKAPQGVWGQRPWTDRVGLATGVAAWGLGQFLWLVTLIGFSSENVILTTLVHAFIEAVAVAASVGIVIGLATPWSRWAYPTPAPPPVLLVPTQPEPRPVDPYAPPDPEPGGGPAAPFPGT